MVSKGLSDEITPSKYSNYANIFFVIEASKLLNSYVMHHIDLLSGKKPPWKPIYSMLAIELEMLWKYLYKKQAKRWIHSSHSFTGTSVIFVKKADSSFHL